MKRPLKVNFCLGCLALFSVFIEPALAQSNNLQINTDRVNVRMSGNGTISINRADQYRNFSSTRVKPSSYRISTPRSSRRARYSQRSCQRQVTRVSGHSNNRVYTRQTNKIQVY